MATILIVDDDANNRLLLTSILSFARHTVLQAEGATQALSLAREHSPQLVIVDLYMPGTSGVELVRSLRSSPELGDVSIVLYTATVRTAAIEDFMSLYGIEHVIPKPCEPEEILDLVRRALGEER